MPANSRISSLKEERHHGTVTFPCAFYQADYHHAGAGMPFVTKHHWHEEIEIIYFEQGTYELKINMKTWTLSEPCFFFVNSGELHSIASKRLYLEQAFVFSPSIISFELPDSSQNLLTRPLISRELSFPGFFPGSHPAFPEILEEFQKIRRIFCQDQPGGQDQYTVSSVPAQLRTKAALLNILSCLEEHHLLSSKKPDSNHSIEALKTVMTYIKENYQEKIYISDLALLVNMNEQYFCRFFKKALGKTPIEYINDFRIRQAVLLMQETELPVMNVCLECGFNNLGHFMKEFKKSTQLTPLQLRKKYVESLHSQNVNIP